MVRDSDLRDNLNGDLERLAAFKADLSHVRNDFHLWGELGYPAGGDGGRGNGHSDSTASAALRAATLAEINKARAACGLRPWLDLTTEMGREFAGIEDDLRMIHLASVRLERRRQLATFTRATTLGVEGCTSCARAKDHDGKPLWTKPYARNKKSRLCRWCFDFESEWGVVPAAELVELHVRDKRKITTRTIREHHPELAEKIDQRARRAS